MLITVIKILCAVTYAAAALLTGRFFIHMFQLNSYKPKVHIKWMFKNRGGYTDAYFTKNVDQSMFCYTKPDNPYTPRYCLSLRFQIFRKSSIKSR